MKHSLRIILVLTFLFFVSQIIGLAIINKDIEVTKYENGTITLQHASEEIIGPPPIEEKTYSFIYIMGMILIGTALAFVLIRFRIISLWKIWFFIAIVFCLSISLSVLISGWVAIIIGLIFAGWRILKPNIIVHNLTEVFIYSGIALVLVQWMNLIAGFLLLVAISIYDMIAVWKSKHMIKLAKFQTKTKLFAGLFIPYKEVSLAEGKKPRIAVKERKAKTAILGGGDIGFPMVFAGVVMENLITSQNIAKPVALLESLIVAVFATIALFLLFVKGKENKYYPAMPFISIGCFIGYGIVFLINFFV